MRMVEKLDKIYVHRYYTDSAGGIVEYNTKEVNHYDVEDSEY